MNQINRVNADDMSLSAVLDTVQPTEQFQTQFTPPATNIFSSGLFLVLKHQIWCLFTSALCLTQSFSVHKWTPNSNRHRNAHILSSCEVRQWTLQKHAYQFYTFCFRHPANLHRSFEEMSADVRCNWESELRCMNSQRTSIKPYEQLQPHAHRSSNKTFDFSFNNSHQMSSQQPFLISARASRKWWSFACFITSNDSKIAR